MDRHGPVRLDMELRMSTIEKYACGKYPRARTVPWKEVDHVYGIANLVGHSHWVCYTLNFQGQKVVVYDSLGRSGVRHVADAFKYVVRNVAILIQKHSWRGIGPEAGLKDIWDLKVDGDAPETNSCNALPRVIAPQF